MAKRGFEIALREERKVPSQQQGAGSLEFALSEDFLKAQSQQGVGSVYLAIDHSASMGEGDKLDQAKRGSRNFVREALAMGYLVGLIQFDGSPSHLCEPKKEIEVLEQHINAIRIGFYTNITEAIKLADEKLRERTGFRVIVVATDGEPWPPDSKEAALRAAEQIKKSGIDIIAIGTDDADKDFLKKLASRADLGVKVTREQFGPSIAGAAKMLPMLPKRTN